MTKTKIKSENKTKTINKIKEWLRGRYMLAVLLLLLAANHLYMHIEVFGLSGLSLMYKYDALTYTAFDVLCFLLIFCLLTLMRSRRAAYMLTWAALTVVDMSNVVYSRFFQQYLSFTALGEAKNLSDSWWMEYVPLAFHWSDLFIVLTSTVFIYILFSPRFKSMFHKQHTNIKPLLCLFIIIILPHWVLSDLVTVRNGEFPATFSDYISEIQGKAFNDKFNVVPQLYTCRFGLVRTQFINALVQGDGTIELTDKDKTEIQRFIDTSLSAPLCDSLTTLRKQRPNVVFIIVESYLSVVSDMTIAGKEVTPNLNRLRHSTGTYYNGNVHTCITTGESSDAQVMYFAGLLPLQNEITVGHLTNNKLYALPALLRDSLHYTTAMTIPTKTYVWHQNEINERYGIDSLYSTIHDKMTFMGSDQDVFDLAANKEKSLKQPFLDVILTGSMHSPYDKSEVDDNVTFTFPSSFSKQYRNYLIACHYMDKQLGRYIESLKQRGLYSNSLIVIVGDHQAHANLVAMNKRDINNEMIPLYLINIGSDASLLPDHNISQLDLFPTIIDLMGIHSKWLGVGHSLCRQYPDSSLPVTQKQKSISELIIRGDWFDK